MVIPLTGQLDGLPPDVAPATMARTASTRLWRTYADEAAVIEETEAQVDSRAGHLGSLPLLVVTAGALEGVDPLEAAEHLERQVDLVTMSTNGRHVVMEHASHLNIILEEQHARELAGHIQDLMAELRDSSVRSPR